MYVKEDLAVLAQRNAKRYSEKVSKRRRQNKIKKVALGILVAAFFITGFKIVGDNDLESEGIVIAKESETDITITEEATVWYGKFVQTSDGLLRKADTDLPYGTKVIIQYIDDGTAHPGDDVVFNVIKK